MGVNSQYIQHVSLVHINKSIRVRGKFRVRDGVGGGFRVRVRASARARAR